jgi:peptidoglycan hydrolase-like protein with peptidoglycan-binding domain
MLQNKDAILMKGSHNQESKVVGIKDTIKLIQCIVGTDIDGIFGNDTKDKVEAFQVEKGLTKDGKVGENTINKMIELELIKI